MALGSEPAWWNDAETRIWSDQPVNLDNYAPVAAGQLKHVAAMAAGYLDDRLQAGGGAGPAIDALIAGFEPSSDHLAVVNVGQLKHVGSLFYARLAAIGAPGAQPPWTSPADPQEHYAPATIGQLKTVFSFDVDTWIGTDADADGLADWWELLHWQNLTTADGFEDHDGDSLTTLEEFQLGTSPELVDSDADGFTDRDEGLRSSDPTTADSIPQGLDEQGEPIAGAFLESRSFRFYLDFYGRTMRWSGRPSVHAIVTPTWDAAVAAWDQPLSLAGWGEEVPGGWVIPPGTAPPGSATTARLTYDGWNDRVDATGTKVELRLRRNAPADYAETRHFLKVREVDGQVTEVEVESLTIDPGETVTDPAHTITLEAPFTEPSQAYVWVEQREYLVPVEVVADHNRDGALENSPDARPAGLVEQGAYAADGTFQQSGAIVWANLDHDEENVASAKPVPDTIRFWHNGLTFEFSDEDYQIRNGERSIAPYLEGYEAPPAAERRTPCPDVAPILFAGLNSLPADWKVFLRVARTKDVKAFHLYKRIPDFAQGDAAETAIWGSFQQTGAPWMSEDHVVDSQTIDLTKWVNENAANYLGYQATRRTEDAPIVFGVEAMLYKGMKHGFNNGQGGDEFDGTLDFTLILKNAEGQEIEVDRFRLTCLRLPAFPGAQGFGKWSQGGRGGEVYVVNSLAASGAGTLKDAMENRVRIKDANGNDTSRLLPRTIVFAKSGMVDLGPHGSASAEGGSLTIAGQSAPGDGITVKNGNLKFGRSYAKDTAGNQVLPPPDDFRRASDFVVRYLRVRRTPTGGSSPPSNPDAVSITSATRFIMDHCSIAWGADGGLDVNVLERPKNAALVPGGALPSEQPEMDITAQWCLVNQTLLDHSKGVLWRGKHGGRYSLIGCYLSSNDERNPVFAHLGDAVQAGDSVGCLFEAVNNVIYNWGDVNAGTMNGASSFVRLQFLANYYKKGPDTPFLSAKAFEIQDSPKVRFEDNEWNGSLWDSWHQYVASYWTAIPQGTRFSSDAAPFVSASNCVGSLSLHAGASRSRDAVDTAHINDVLASGTSGNSAGGIVTNAPSALWAVYPATGNGPADTDGDGMADAWEQRHGDLTMLPWKDADGDGWTNLEEYLNGTDPLTGDDPMLVQSSAVFGALEDK